MEKKYLMNLLFMLGFLFVIPAVSQNRDQLEQITRRYDKEKLKDLKDQFERKYTSQKEKAVQLAKQNNWPLTIKENGTFAELQQVAEDGSPIYYTTYNVAAAKSTRTNHLNGGGSLGLNLDGQNMIAYVWDAGHSTVAHQEFDGAGGNNRVTVEDAASEGGTDLHFHAIHVTGTIAASGFKANSKGMASQVQVKGYKWNNDIAEVTAAASNGMLLSNHSYGMRTALIPDQYFGAYTFVSRDWDEVMFNAPNYLMVVSAGNDGDNNYNENPLGGNSAYDKLAGHATSKNNLVVANAQDANIDANGNLVSISINSSSSEGPTDDLRIKPDITGNGTGVYSSFHFPSWDEATTGPNLSDGNINDDYASISGTSMSSPNVMGSLLLLQQHANNVKGSFMKAATLKGLALHTADDAGDNGPDAIFGWGLLNVKRAAKVITTEGKNSLIEELTLTNGQSYQITVDSDGINDLMASISWTDRPGAATLNSNSGVSRLVNDLDIRVTKGGISYSPWRLTAIRINGKGDNSKDPYERVDIPNASGTYTITITHKGSLTGGSQNYSLIVTGLPKFCASRGNSVRDEYISRVRVGSINNASGAQLYSNFTAISTDLSKEYAHNITITPTWTGTIFPEGYAAWIDYNQDGDFTDFGEQIFSKAPSTAPEVIGSFTIPDGAVIGKTRMRVAMKYNGIPSSCETFSWGEVEDYTVNITGGSKPTGSCTNTVLSSQYTENFEVIYGLWTQSSDDDFDWTVRSGATPSSGTGPSSAAVGNKYAYMESSSPNNSNDVAILDFPCFDLSGKNQPIFSFKYHMYGASIGMGSLRLQVSKKNGSSWTYWSTVWSKLGNQGNSWKSASVDLSSYANSTIRLRFHGITGVSWQGDMAIDDIRLKNGTAKRADEGFEKEIAVEDISIYPNPVKGNILYVKSNIENLPFTVVNMLGQEVIRGTLANSLDVSNLETGLYIIQFNVNDKIETRKFIKQ